MGFGSYSSPARRMGFGDPAQAPQELNSIEARDLLGRHPQLAEDVAQFEWQLQHFGSYDIHEAGRYPARWAIAPWGATVRDTQWGPVIVHPDAGGRLRFVASAPPEVVAAVDQAPFRSDSGEPVRELLDDLLRHAAPPAFEALTWAPWLILGAAAFGAYRAFA